MKKKIWILLIIPIVVFGFNFNVKAANKSSCTGGTVKISGSATGNVKIEYPGGATSNYYFYKQTINGQPALCLDRRKNSSTTYKYEGMPFEASSISSGAKAVIFKAYNFLKGGSDNLRWAVAQAAVWYAMEGHAKLRYSGDSGFISTVTSIYCAVNYDNLPRTGNRDRDCLKGGRSYDSVPKEQIRGVITTFDNQATSYSGLYIYTTSQSSSAQRIVSYMYCPDKTTTTDTYSCTDGTKKTQMTTCVNEKVKNGSSKTAAYDECFKNYCENPAIIQQKCYYEIVKNGTPAVCNFTNSNNTGTFYESVQKSCNNTANQFGAPEEYFVNNTCRLYCLESAKQSFPGNVAPALSKGTILVWPTSKTNTISLSKNIYPIEFQGTRKCYLIMDGATDVDIYEKESPFVRYTNAYNKVVSLYSSRETIGTVSTQFGGVSHATQHTYEQIRTENIGNALSTTACTVHYSSYSNELNIAISNASSAINNWISSHTCTGTRNVGSCAEYNKTTGKCAICGSDGCPREETYTRACTISDTPYENDYNKLISMKSRLETSISTCTTYITNYILMKDTYLQVAACNNKEIDPKSIYNFETDAAMSFEGANGTENVVLSKESEKYTCTNCSNPNQLTTSDSDMKNLYFFTNNYSPTRFAELVNSLNPGGIRMREVTVDVDVTYTLPPDNVVEDKGNGNFSTAKYNGFKILKESIVGKKYNLKIFNTVLGHKNTFADLVNKDYTCNYEVTETVTPDCICPEGTDNAGKDLYCMIADSNTTCIEAQINYCNDSTITIPDECDFDEFCPNDYSKKLTPCIDAGYTRDYCENLICKSSISNTYRCKNTNGVGGKMDITSCVYTKMAQGLSEQSAIDECDSIICPISGGLRIIYRTISLENPFPGKTISGGVSGFNTDVKGRYPGTNWNSVNVVKNEILYSRTHSQSSYGSKIYQNETPLYTFVLNSTTINAIRSYNDTHKYDDFELDCKKNNATACVSTFVHDSNLSGLVGGTCQYNTSKTNFYKCSDDA